MVLMWIYKYNDSLVSICAYIYNNNDNSLHIFPLILYTPITMVETRKLRIAPRGTNIFRGVIGKIYENSYPHLQTWPNYATLSRYVKQILHIFHCILQ